MGLQPAVFTNHDAAWKQVERLQSDFMDRLLEKTGLGMNRGQLGYWVGPQGLSKNVVVLENALVEGKTQPLGQGHRCSEIRHMVKQLKLGFGLFLPNHGNVDRMLEVPCSASCADR